MVDQYFYPIELLVDLMKEQTGMYADDPADRKRRQ